MADKEIDDLTAASTPLAGTETLLITQSSNSRKTTVDAIRDITSLTGKTTPVDADEFRIWDSAATAFKKLTFANLAAWVKAFFNASGSAPVYAVRAWGNINGTGTVAIRASGNVSSITDNGVGDYTVNFTTALPDANYAVNVTTSYAAGPSYPAAIAIFGNNSTGATVTPSASAFRFNTRYSTATPSDFEYITFTVVR